MPFNRLNHNVLGEIRPRFSLKIECEPEEALEHLTNQLLKDKTVSGYRSKTLVFLKTPSWEQHYWSPELTARIEVEEYTDYTSVSALVGPRQTVWALWAFIYSGLAVATLFGGMFALVKYSQQSDTSLLWIIPAGIFSILTAFIFAKIGQRKGRDQMLHLVSFLYHTLDEITEVERIKN
jgi:hypothetical protein